MTQYNESIHYDKRMYSADIAGSKAYVRALQECKILNSAETTAILDGLDVVREEWADETFVIRPADEDIHTANERRLGELIGPVAGKLHTGRSRNDQVATDMRLWMRDEIQDLKEILKVLLRTLAERANEEINVLMPGYTHLQRAQPIRWSHWLMSYACYFATDLEKLEQVGARVNLSPLGCGALAGNPFGINRRLLAEELGFDDIIPNSLVAVADRDFVVEFLSWASQMMLHMSRLAEDLVLFSTAEFGFIKLADAYSTGSSLMPQKKNPDSLELLRGKCGRVFGQMCGFMMTLKALPSTYNKDLQEDKEPLFDCTSTSKNSINIAIGLLSTLTIDPAKMKAALSADMLATDLADYLVRRGVPFRETHHISGEAVSFAEKSHRHLDQLSLEEFRSIDPRFESDVLEIFDFEESVQKRYAAGGTSKDSVLMQIHNVWEKISA